MIKLSLCKFVLHPVMTKIMTRPLPRQRIQYHTNPKLIQRISLRGEKYASRVAATGEYTLEILNQIKNTSTIKVIQSLTFDPYFCTESGLRQLSVILKKFKGSISHLHLVIRRFNESRRN